MSEPSKPGDLFAELVSIMERLRAPGGCPWDREQSFASIKAYLLEECYEVMDTIDGQDWDGLAEELGDLLLQPVFLAEMAREQKLFDISDSLRAINEKLIRRHPHVFGDASASTADEVKVHWDAIKLQEKNNRGTSKPQSELDGVPRSLPALVEAEKISKKAAKLGFEWPSIDGVFEKLAEETAELEQARVHGDELAIEHEIGDLLFTVVNLARFLKVDPEQALRKTNGRFRNRFGYVEQHVQNMQESSLEEMEMLWGEAKKLAI